MEKGNIHVIKKTEEEWRGRKKLLRFSDAEIIPEILEPVPEAFQARVKIFLLDLIDAQVLLEVFKDLQTDSSALEKLRHGLFGRQRSFIKLLKSGTKDIKKEKLGLVSAITEVFSDCSIKIKAVLDLMEQEYQATNAYKILQKLSIILEKFISDLRQSAPQNAEQIISEFRKSLSEIIEIKKK